MGKVMDNQEIVVQPKPMTRWNLICIVAGSIMYAGAVNLFLTPLKLYAAGIPGLSQMLRTLFFANVTSIDIAGIINLMFNIPLFLLAWKSLSKKMVAGTLLSVAVQTVTFTLLRAPAIPILDDKLACIVIAGLLGGIGCGVVLTNGGSAGGLDLLGVYVTQHSKNFTVGWLSVVFNAVLYTVMAVIFDLGTALYSVIFVAVFSFVIDRWHYQNIEVEMMIFTHDEAVKDMIMKKYVRGVTCWQGMGAYTKLGTEVLVTIVAKSEVNEVKRDILEIDPKAFIIVHEGTHVTGGYQKRLV